MSFINFTLWLIGGYIIYFSGIYLYDLYHCKKQLKEKGEEIIDISTSLENYVPKDAKEVIEKEKKQGTIKSEEVEKKLDEEPIQVNMNGGYSVNDFNKIWEEVKSESSIFEGINLNINLDNK